MKKSVKYQIIAVSVLAVLAVIDAFSVFIPIVAILGIILFLFKPKWFFSFVQKIYS